MSPVRNKNPDVCQAARHEATSRPPVCPFTLRVYACPAGAPQGVHEVATSKYRRLADDGAGSHRNSQGYVGHLAPVCHKEWITKRRIGWGGGAVMRTCFMCVTRMHLELQND